MIDDTTQGVDKFLKMSNVDKLLIVCHTKKEVAQVAAQDFITGNLLGVTGDTPTEDKVQIIDSYLLQIIQREF